MPSLSVLVIGATGTVGRFITPVLAQRKGEFNRVAFHSRSGITPDKEALYAALEAQGLERVEGNVRDISLYRGKILFYKLLDP